MASSLSKAFEEASMALRLQQERDATYPVKVCVKCWAPWSENPCKFCGGIVFWRLDAPLDHQGPPTETPQDGLESPE